MTFKQLSQVLADAQRRCPELKNLYLNTSDARAGNLVRLASVNENGAIFAKTSFMSHGEMYAYLCGYFAKHEKAFV